MVSLVIFTSLGLVVERTLTVAQQTERYLNAVNRTTRRGQDLGYELFDVVNASRKMYQNDALGNAYLTAIDLSAAPPAPGCRLPLFDETGILNPDQPGDPRTGNILLFVRESDPAPCVADVATGKIRFVDTYRFLCIYQHETARQIVTDSPNALDLHTWRSVAFPSYAQLMGIEDEAERRSVVRDLHLRFGYETAWDPNAEVDAAFFAMDAVGTLAVTPYSPYTIESDANLSDAGRLVYANIQLARTDASSQPRRALLTRDPDVDWVPNGFEVKVVGASGSRKVWMHLVLEAQSARGLVAAHASTLIASTRDL
jgi:hypothetical protein